MIHIEKYNERRSSRKRNRNQKVFTTRTAESDQEAKNRWWVKNQIELIKVASEIRYDDWLVIFKGNQNRVNKLQNMPARRKAISLFHAISLEDLDDMVHDNIIN